MDEADECNLYQVSSVAQHFWCIIAYQYFVGFLLFLVAFFPLLSKHFSPAALVTIRRFWHGWVLHSMVILFSATFCENAAIYVFLFSDWFLAVLNQIRRIAPVAMVSECYYIVYDCLDECKISAMLTLCLFPHNLFFFGLCSIVVYHIV